MQSDISGNQKYPPGRQKNLISARRGCSGLDSQHWETEISGPLGFPVSQETTPLGKKKEKGKKEIGKENNPETAEGLHDDVAYHTDVCL